MKEIIIMYLECRNGDIVELQFPDSPGKKWFYQPDGKPKRFMGMKVVRCFRAAMYTDYPLFVRQERVK